MLWLCLYFPRLPAEALNLRDEGSAAVAQHGSRRWLVTDVPGVRAGTPLSSALTLQPKISAQLRRPAAERERLRALAHAVYRYGSPVCSQIVEPHNEGQLPLPLLWVEVGESLQLYGGLEALRDALCADLMELGAPARLALAPTRLGAVLLARAGDTVPAFEVPDLCAQLAPLSLQLLPWPDDLLETLRGLGLRTLGEVFALPRAEFARRFGAQWLLQLDRIRGQAPHPFQAIHLPLRFERRFEFFQEVETSEGLLFPLRRLCVELQHYLRARDRGVRTLALTLLHAQGARSGFTHRYTAPTRDAAHLFDTLRERLQRMEPGAPVRELKLSAEDFAQPPTQQADFFHEAAGALEWQQTVERLRARLGDATVWVPACTGDHRPERAWCPAQVPATAPPEEFPPRPAWLLHEPRRIESPSGGEAGMERIESGWWDGQPMRRDYYTAELRGGRAWIYQDLDSRQWYLHGWWA